METQRLFVTGMTCGGCADTVARALHAVDGVIAADVSLDSSTATIQLDPKRTSVEALAQAVQRAGYDTLEDKTIGATQSQGKGCCGGR